MFPKYNIGKNGELYVRDIFLKCGFPVEMNNVYEKRYDWDLSTVVNNINYTIEVKHDIMSIKTKNIAIEYHNSKKNSPSGINATLADIWVHLVPYPNTHIHAYAIGVGKLKKYIEEHEPFKHIIAGGDDNSNIFIYKMTEILPYFTRIDTIENADIMQSVLEGLVDD